MPSVLSEHFRSDDAYFGQDISNHREFKDQSCTQERSGNEAEIFRHINAVLDQSGAKRR